MEIFQHLSLATRSTSGWPTAQPHAPPWDYEQEILGRSGPRLLSAVLRRDTKSKAFADSCMRRFCRQE
jgi:hypothetical protein